MVSLLETVVKRSDCYQITAGLGPFLEWKAAKKAYWFFSGFSVAYFSPCYSWNLACFPVYDVRLLIFFLGCDKLLIYIGVCLTKKQLFAVIYSAGWREICLIQEMVGISVVHMFGVKLQRKMVYNWWNVEWNSCRQLLITHIYL